MQNHKSAFLLWLMPCITILSIFLWQSRQFIIHDFANYYYGAYALSNNIFDVNIYNALHFNTLLKSEGFDNLFVNYYPNTPFLSFTFLPLLHFDWQAAKLIYNIIGSLLFITAFCRLNSFYKLPFWSFLLIPIILLVAIKNNILFGQSYFILFFLLAEGLLFYEKKKYTISTVCWSIAILIKVFPIVIFVWLFFKKDFLSISKLLFSCIFFIALSLPIIGYEVWEYYTSAVFPASSSGLIYDGFTTQANSSIMFFKSIFMKDILLNPTPIYESNFLFLTSNIVFKSLILTACASASYYRPKDTLFLFSIWIIASLLIAPTNSSYSKLLLIFPLLYTLSSINQIKPNKYIMILLITFLIVNVATQYITELPLPINFLNLFFLLILFWLILSLHNFKWSWIILVGFLTLFGIQTFLNPPSKSEYAYSESLDHPPPLIMSDIDVSSGFLRYQYWGINGQTYMETNYKAEEYSTSKVAIIDNQIFYNNVQITNTKDRKLSPYLINNSVIIFLSDSGRSPGCYTIRKLNI